MVKNIGENARFYCMHGHKEPIEMVIKEGHSVFYACPKYMAKDEAHPDGYVRGEELACTNQLSFDDAYGLLMDLDRQIEEDLSEMVIGDYTNTKLKHKSIDAKVLVYKKDRLDIGVINKRAINR